MKTIKTFKNNQGFTLIELMFAITVIGVMMGIVLTTIVGMLRFYTFSGTVRQNQQNARQTLDNMTREVRFAKLVLPTAANATSNVLCVADEKQQQLIRYEVPSGSTDLSRTVYSYLGTAIPVNCITPDIVTATSKLNLDRMRIKKLEFIRTAGATIQEFDSKAAAVDINISYVSGTPDPATGNCVPNDIYCTSLQLVTAVNIRGKSE